MLNSNKLRGVMAEKNMTAEKLSNILGINPTTFYRKRDGISEFTRSEIQIIANVLELTMEDVESIFFSPELADTQETPA